MDIRRLNYFLTVAAEGSFSQAAEVLHMTQPPLSTAIADLEKELGVRLLTRNARGVAPTAAGFYLVAAGGKLLDDMEGMCQDLRNMGLGVKGKISVASVPILTWTLLPEVLRPFLSSAPGVDVSVSDPPPAQAIDMVLRKEVDLGVIATVSIDQLRDSYRSTLHVMQVAELPMLLGLPPRMADAPQAVHLADLHEETWLVPERSLRIRGLLDMFNSLWEGLHLTPPVVRPVTTLQTAIPLVVAGLGLTLLPRSLRTMAHPSLIVREIADEVRPMHAAVIWPKDIDPAPAMTALLNEFERVSMQQPAAASPAERWSKPPPTE